MERTPHDFTALRMVCSECQRRKQKCNKQWPCNHCTRRKVADKCRYNLAPTADEVVTVSVSNLKRRSQPEATSGITEQLRSLSIGYVTTEMLAGLGIAGEAVTTPDDGQFWADAKSCDALNRTLKLLPKGHRIDALLEAFLGNANPQFYIIYPAKFLEEYGQWRVRVSNALPIGLHWTCLLLSVIACSIQHIHTSARDSLERELGDTVEALSERYHSLSRELYNAIPPGYEHLLACQWLLQSAYWYISQAKYRETWHVLSAAVRQAQQLGLDSDSACTQLSEFEREMQRRVWCIIQILDWQISAGLSRPTIVRWANAEVRVPAVTMEGDAISPMLHLIVQSQLITRLATNYSDTTKVSTPQEVCQYETIITEWALSLPRPYALENPDTSMDSVNPWIVFNRHYLHVVIYFMRLTPLRRFMLQEYDDVPSEKVHSICLDGFRFCMEALRICQRWADHVAEHGGGYHFVVSSAFDSMTLFCTALIKGIHGNVMKYMDINETIDKGLLLLSRLHSHSPEAKTALDVMRELVQRVPVYGIRQNQKRQKLDHVSELVTSQPMANQVTATSSIASNAAFVDIEVPEVPFTMPTANVLDASISTTAPFASLAALSIPAFAPVLPSVAAEDQALLPTSLRGGAEATQFLMVESIPIIGTNMLPASADDYTSSITDPTWYSYDNALWDWGAIESGMYQHDESGK